MPNIAAKAGAVACVLGAGLVLSGCAVSRLHIADDYGQAVRQDLVAQVADPDAVYKGVPAPGSDGHRVGIAQGGYVRNSVVQPASTTTSNVSLGGGGGGGSGGGGGAGAATGPE